MDAQIRHTPSLTTDRHERVGLLSDGCDRCKRIEDALRARGISFLVVPKVNGRSRRYSLPAVHVPSEGKIYSGEAGIEIFLDRFAE